MANRHNYNKNEELLFKSIKNLKNYCFDEEEFSFKITSESDLKCFLYSELINSKKTMKESNIKLINEKSNKQSNKKVKSPLIITEYRYFKNNKDKFCDLIILDPNELTYYYEFIKKSKKNQIMDMELNEILNESVCVELKWTWANNKSSTLQKIKTDLNKLNQKEIKRRYVILFDQFGNLNEQDVLNITTNKGHKIFYIDNVNKKIHTYPQNLKNKL